MLDANETPAVASAEPVTQAPVAPAAEAAPPTPWNGELEALEKLPWWQSVPETARSQFKGGYESKVKNLEKGYQEKYRGAAEDRKRLDAERKEVDGARRRAELLTAMYGGDESSADAVTKELEDLRSFKTQSEQRESARFNAEVAAEEVKITAAYGDILKNDAAAGLFERLVAADMDIDEAAAIVRGRHPTKEEAPDPWARAARAAGRGDESKTGGGGGIQFNGRNFDDVMNDAADRASSKTRGR